MKDTKEAERAVAALEAIGDGEAYAPAREEATNACAALREAHHPRVFPARLEPMDAAVVLIYNDHRDRCSVHRFVPELVQLHAAAVADYPALARCARGFFGRRDVFDAALAQSPAAGDDHARAEVRRFEDAVAAQLVADPEIGPSARIIAETVPALQGRIAAAVDRQHAHAAAESTRRAVEGQAQRAATAAALASRRQSVSGFFGAFASHTFFLRGRTFFGTDLAAAALGNMAIDRVTGQPTGGITLEELERLREQHEATSGARA